MPHGSSFSISSLFATTLLLVETTLGNPRADIVQLECDQIAYRNANIAVQNFFGTMNKIGQLIQSSHSAVASTGSGPDASYGLAQCYGDLSAIECVTCYSAARTNIPACFPITSGRLYLDGCFMRHENYRFFDQYKGPKDKVMCANRTQKNIMFLGTARQAVQQAIIAAVGNRGYSQIKAAVPQTANKSAYALANCWETLNTSFCRACLENAGSSLLECLPQSEGRALYTGCFLRYSDTDFLNAEPGKGSSRGTTVVIIIVAVISSVAVLVIAAAVGLYIRKRIKIQNKRKGSNDADIFIKLLEGSGLNFKYSILEKATGSFAQANKLGQGGYGTVYKGVLPDGREIAVKRLFFNNAHRAADFYNEVNIISSTEHKNLVRLLGCSFSGPESLLVYEFFPNGSLDQFIFDPNRSHILDWEKRFEIIVGTAEGLAHLHGNASVKIIHRDIKASNILLDSKFGAKIADFGLARSFQEDESHISTAIAGTLGYLAPEYLAHGRLTEKADVYCFGMLVLEIVTGRRQTNVSQSSSYLDSVLVTAWKHFQEGQVEKLIDQNMFSCNEHECMIPMKKILRAVHIGFLCTQEMAQLRPEMEEVVRMLMNGDEGKDLPAPTDPPFIYQQAMKGGRMTGDLTFALNSGAPSSVATVSHSSFHPW